MTNIFALLANANNKPAPKSRGCTTKLINAGFTAKAAGKAAMVMSRNPKRKMENFDRRTGLLKVKAKKSAK
tara:strand:- start:4128 stop:4340 length:213 start_codon:yes stop_codon:yes gene_type:complete